MSEYLPAVSEAHAVMGQLERMVRDPNIQVDKIESLYRMMKEERHHTEVRAFNQAMRRAQLEMEPIVRDVENSHTGTKYARLEKIDGIMRPIYTSHGFSVRYGSAVCPIPEWQRITCTVSHDDGHFETHFLDAPPDMTGAKGRPNKTGAQAVGSIVTYLRRYLLAMVFNIVLADEDDDGQGGQQQQTETRKQPLRTHAWLQPLEERDHRQWMLNVKRLLDEATEEQQVNAIATHRNVQRAISTGSPKLSQSLRDYITVTRARITGQSIDDDGDFDPIADLRPMIAAMTLEDIRNISHNTTVQNLMSDLLPPDMDAVNELIELRRAELMKGEIDGTETNGSSAGTGTGPDTQASEHEGPG